MIAGVTRSTFWYGCQRTTLIVMLDPERHGTMEWLVEGSRFIRLSRRV